MNLGLRPRLVCCRAFGPWKATAQRHAICSKVASFHNNYFSSSRVSASLGHTLTTCPCLPDVRLAAVAIVCFRLALVRVECAGRAAWTAVAGGKMVLLGRGCRLSTRLEVVAMPETEAEIAPASTAAWAELRWETPKRKPRRTSNAAEVLFMDDSS